MKNTPFFSIILPTYNRLYLLKEILLPSIEKQTFTDYELIVIDDNSSDNTEVFFKSEKFQRDYNKLSQRTNHIKNHRNLGSPRSRNIGIHNAIGRWIFMIEDDLELRTTNFLSRAQKLIIKYLHIDKKIAVFCPKIEDTILTGYYKNYNRKLINYGVISKNIYCDPLQEYSGYIENARACSFIKAGIAKNFLFNTENYKYFREESDFFERIKRNGYKLFYLGDKLKTYHRTDLSKEGGNRKNSISNIKNEFNFTRSHYRYIQRFFAFPQIRILFFVLIRWIKHFANLSKLTFIKNILSFLRV